MDIASPRTVRTALGWTQTQMAGHMGVTRLTISNWERGKFIPRNAVREYERLANDAKQ